MMGDLLRTIKFCVPLGDGLVPGDLWATNWFLETFGRRIGFWRPLGDELVLGDLWATDWFLETFGRELDLN